MEIADKPEKIPDILIIRVDVLVLFHRLRHLMYTWWPIWGRGGGVSFIFVSIHSVVHALTVLTFFSSFLCTMKQLWLVRHQ